MADRCSSCGAEIEWGITSKARRIPLDPLARGNAQCNIAVIGTFANGTVAVDVVKAGAGSRVSHFATCPNAGQHRRRT